MTRHFPHPGPRFQVDPRYPDDNVRVMVPEIQRRSSHLKLISSTHPLKGIALNCLEGKERKRPSAQQLSNTLFELKETPQYVESLQHAQTGEVRGLEVASLRRQLQDLQQQEQEQRKENEDLQRRNQEQQQENEHLHQQQQHCIAHVHWLEQQLQGQHALTEASGRKIQELQSVVEEQEREIQANVRELQCKDHTVQTKEKELHASEELVAQFQQSMEKKDRIIRDLQLTLSAHERHIQQLEEHMRASSGQPQQVPVTADILQETPSAAQKDITKLRWREGKRVPEGMVRGAVVVDGNTIYINSWNSRKVYSCQISEEVLWFDLCDSHYLNYSLAIIDGLLTCVGGHSGGYFVGPRTNILHSLSGESIKRQWSEVFPPMPTARSETASVTTEQALVVVGGYDGRKILDRVEVMNIATKQWATAKCLPYPFASISGTICRDQLYLGGGVIGSRGTSKSVLTCSLSDLLLPQSLDVRLPTLSQATKPRVWREIKKLPVTWSTLTRFGGHLLAVGGKSDSFFYGSTAKIYCYNHQTDSWHVTAEMKNKRYRSLSAATLENQLLVVGGLNDESESMTTVDIGSLPVSV